MINRNNLNKMWIKADKSRNLYKIDPLLYKKILHDKITEKYKSDQDNIIDQINKDTYNFTNKLNIKNKLGKLNRKNAYIIFKDHKQNFENNKQASFIIKKYSTKNCYQNFE